MLNDRYTVSKKHARIQHISSTSSISLLSLSLTIVEALRRRSWYSKIKSMSDARLARLFFLSCSSWLVWINNCYWANKLDCLKEDLTMKVFKVEVVFSIWTNYPPCCSFLVRAGSELCFCTKAGSCLHSLWRKPCQHCSLLYLDFIHLLMQAEVCWPLSQLPMNVCNIIFPPCLDVKVFWWRPRTAPMQPLCIILHSEAQSEL